MNEYGTILRADAQLSVNVFGSNIYSIHGHELTHYLDILTVLLSCRGVASLARENVSVLAGLLSTLSNSSAACHTRHDAS